ncbi:MAG: ribonuclease domain-containing protein [Aeromicrobium sp.]
MRSRLLLAVLLAIVGVYLVTQYEATDPEPPSQPQSTASQTSIPQPQSTASQTSIPDSLTSLPREALDTIKLIQSDGPFPYSKDGTVFTNRERRLPDRGRGYWREYTVETPGESDRGARRIVHGEGDEYYYTDDHYASFKRLRVPDLANR